MNLLDEAKKLTRYLFSKKSELEQLEIKDVVMAKAILDIHRKKLRKQVVSVPLFALCPIHTLDRENAMQAVQKRIEVLSASKSEILEKGILTCEMLAQILPSVSWIKVVQDPFNNFLAFEGNGRIAAIKAVFESDNDLLVEVEQYEFRNSKKIIRRLNRVRRLNGLL